VIEIFRSVRRALACFALLSAALVAGDAYAHGPTFHFGRDSLEPEQVTIAVGGVVHFHNHDFMPGGMKLRATDGSFESPPLGRDQSWHHTFEAAGVYEFEIVGFGKKGRIVVEAPEAKKPEEAKQPGAPD